MNIIETIAREFQLRESQVQQTVALIDEGNTIPFIARYRKEATGGLSDVVLRDMDERLTYLRNLQERKELDEFYAPYNVPAEDMYPNVFFDESEIEQIGILQTDIDSYVMQKYAEWIVNGGIDAEWDGFQQKLKDMDVDSYIKIYTDAYERYMAE